MRFDARRLLTRGPTWSKAACIVVAGFVASDCARGNRMNSLGERYVRLVLAVGQHDADYVDAYYGPPEWRAEAEALKLTLPEIASRAGTLARDIAAAAPPASADQLTQLRHVYLQRQLASIQSRVSTLAGVRMSFDEESAALYDAVAPTHPGTHFDAVLSKLEARLPGSGSLLERYEEFRKAFVIPPDRLDRTFKAAIEGCRSRTLQHVTLPVEESFTVEYVTGKSWSGYNWYQGGYRSLIQVNTELPIYADRAVDLACHEGYPGHHVYNVLLEKHLVRDRGWVEFSVYPLFSPQSLIAEGTANFGIDVAFAKSERVDFEQRVIFPAAGLSAADAARYYDVLDLVAQLSYAGDEAARQYLDGRIDADTAAGWLEKYGLYSPPRARQRVRFFDQYRSYVINYTLGKDLVAAHVEARGGTPNNAAKRWQEFEALISSPRLPSGLTRR